MNSHLTAIHRKKPSLPLRFLLSDKERAKAIRSGPTIDWGCGRGADASFLGCRKYDPYWSPEMPKGKFACILCFYVLNVISEEEQEVILNQMRKKLRKGGVIFIAVRRDMNESYVSSRGTSQRLVYLDLPILVDNSGFCLYQWRLK